MANGKSFAFLAGAFFGAVGAYLAFTEKGKEIRDDLRCKSEEWYEDGRACLLRKYDRFKEDFGCGCEENDAAEEEL